MRRTFLIGYSLVFSVLFSGAVNAQQHGGYGGGGGHTAGLAPVGSVGRAPIVAPFGRSSPYYGGSSVYANSYRGRRGLGYGYGYGIGAYPVYVGGFSGDYYPGYTDPNLGAPGGGDYQAAPPAAPAVVINQYFTAPPGPGGAPAPEDSNMQSYSQAPPAPSQAASQAAPEPRSYLIAFKDHSVYSALAYWVEDHTLHYVTTQNTHNQADVTEVDLDFTKKLNSDRNMPFSLTPATH